MLTSTEVVVQAHDEIAWKVSTHGKEPVLRVAIGSGRIGLLGDATLTLDAKALHELTNVLIEAGAELRREIEKAIAEPHEPAEAAA